MYPGSLYTHLPPCKKEQDNEVNHVNIIEINGWFQFGNDGQPFQSLLGLINFLISDKMIIRPLPGKEKYRRRALEIWKHDRVGKRSVTYAYAFKEVYTIVISSRCL